MSKIRCMMLVALLAGAAPAQDDGPEAAKRLSNATAALAAGKSTAAVLILEDLVAKQPELGAAWFQLALARRLLKRDVDAFKAADEALRLMPDSLEAKLLMAEICADSDPRRASQLVLPLAAGCDDEALLRRILKVLVVADDDGVKVLFEALLKLAPKDVDLLDQQVQWALGKRELPLATRALQQLVALQPRNPLPLQSLAQVQLAAGRGDAAQKTLQELLAINPSNLTARARLIGLLQAEPKPDLAQISEQQRLHEFYRVQQLRWEKQGLTDTKPTSGQPAKPPK